MTETTAGQFAPKLMAFIDAVEAAMPRGLNKALTKINQLAQANLRGGRADAPWSYPVPRRSPAGLYASQGIDKGDGLTYGYVFNSSDHALAVHNGVLSVRTPGGGRTERQVLARPFLDDAVTQADPVMVFQGELEEAMTTWQ